MASGTWVRRGLRLITTCRISIHWIVIALASGLLTSISALADGGFVSKWNKRIAINEPTQKVIIVYDAGREDLLLQVKYETSFRSKPEAQKAVFGNQPSLPPLSNLPRRIQLDAPALNSPAQAAPGEFADTFEIPRHQRRDGTTELKDPAYQIRRPWPSQLPQFQDADLVLVRKAQELPIAIPEATIKKALR